MNIEEQLMLELSRRNTNYIACEIDQDTESFGKLMDLVFSAKEPLPMRASWVVTTLSDQYPELLKPFLKKIIQRMNTFSHPGTRRNLLRSLSLQEIPEGMEGQIYDVCYRFVLSGKEPPAVKVHSMQIMFNIAQKEPELKRELRLIIEDLSRDDSAAIKSRCRQLFALL